MKVLIVYSTHTGNSKKAAEMLAERLMPRAESTLFDIKNSPPSPEGYDAVVLGGSVRFAKLSRKLKKYIKQYKKILSEMPTAVFICCGYVKDYEDYAVMQLPQKLNVSLGVHCFGGELKPDKVNGFNKLVVFVMRQGIAMQDPEDKGEERHELPELNPETIYALAETICGLKGNK